MSKRVTTPVLQGNGHAKISDEQGRQSQLQAPILTNGGSLSIKDVVVADPSIEFTLGIDPAIFPPVEGNVYLKNFQVQLSISNLVQGQPDVLTNVGTLLVNSVTSTTVYYYFTFGDANYQPGVAYKLVFLFSAFDPKTGYPVTFTDNPVTVTVYGSGIVG